MLELILQVILIIFIGLSLYWLVKIKRTYSWIKKYKKFNLVNVQDYPIYVLIPVLWEEKRIEKAVRYFLTYFRDIASLKICLITTEKEYSKGRKGMTIKIAKELASRYAKVIHLHYPDPEGKMAHQVNYGVKQILKKRKDVLFALYNADSRPDSRTLKWVIKDRIMNPQHEVYQQYGYYCSNYYKLGSGLSRMILFAAGSWQNRWSIGFEIPHVLDQFKIRKLFKKIRYPFNYCIGHGLFFTPDIFNQLKGFSEDTHNEDAIFGLELSCLQKKIYPIPFFDLSDSPDNISSLLIQKKNWFFGPLQALNYYQKIYKKNTYLDKKCLLFHSIKLFFHAIYWVAGPTFLFVSILYLLLYFSYVYLIAILITCFIFLALPNYISTKIANAEYNKRILKEISFLTIAIGSLPMYLLHGLSAYMALYSSFMSLIFKREIKKEKTGEELMVRK